jgi:thiol-disulfide isomerase/thioredoxin
MKKVLFLLATAAIFTINPQEVTAHCGDTEKETKLLALTFHADYCSACKKLKPEVMALQPKLKDQPVEWVKFDFTSEKTKKESMKKAEELGVSDIYADNQATGFVLLVDADTKETIARLTSMQTSSEMYDLVIEKL